MKSFNLIFTGAFLLATSAYASNNYLGKADDRAVVIAISPDKASYSSGGKAKFSGTISVTGKKSYDWGNFWDWLFSNKKKGLLEEFQKEGLDITGSFPSSAIDVSSSLKLESNGDDEIKFSYESPSIIAGDLNQLSIRVYNNASDKNRLKQYAAIQAKLERRLAELKNLKKYYQNNRALKEVIAVVEAQIEMFSVLIDKIEDQLNSDDNLIAESIRPIQVDNLAGSLNRSMTSINGFRFSAITDNGIPFEGLPNRLVAKVSKIGDQDKDDDYYKNLGKYGYVSELYKDGSLVTSQILDSKTATATIEYSIPALSSLTQNKFELMLYRTEKGKKKSRIGTMVHYVNVLSDKVKPTWLASSLPNQEDHFVQTPPSISLVASDSFGRINPDSLSVLFSGKNILGQTVSVNLTSSLLQSKDLDGSQYSLSGAISEMAEGDYVLSANVQDFSKNAAVTYKSRLVIDRTAPAISFGNVSGALSSTQVFPLIVSISDKSPVDSQVFLNDVQVSYSSLSTFQVNMTLNPGSNVVKVTAVDKAGNSSSASTAVILDNSPPILTQIMPSEGQKYYTNVFPFSVQYKFTSNEVLSKALVNGVVSSLASDGKSFVGTIVESSAGAKSLVVKGYDLAGNLTTINAVYNVIYDNVVPLVTISGNFPSLTNQSTIPAHIVISDQNPVTSKVLLNGNVLFETGATDFNVPFELGVEGKNTFSIISTDAAGNVGQSNIIEVVRDTTAPNISSLTPTNGQTIFQIMFNLQGAVNEKISQASVNGMPLAIGVDMLTFSGSYFAANQGANTLEIKVSDLAGNVSTKSITVNIQSKLLILDLVSVVPDSQSLDYVYVIGKAGATRPGVKVEVSSGFLNLNSASGTASFEGSFSLRLKKFESANLTVTDSSTSETEKQTIYFLKATKISGVVKDSNDNPLPGVAVSVQGASGQVITDASGVFNYQSNVTGDRVLVVDGTTVPQTVTGPSRKFSKTQIALNVGVGQNNSLTRPVYLTALILDGSETAVSAGQSKEISSSHAPGVTLTVPSNTAIFPDGSSTGTINVTSIPSARTTIAPPEMAVPTNITVFEPSGLSFKNRVPLKLPNDNELPAGTEMIIFSMNSQKGIWEVDGRAIVSSDGSSVETLPNEGISHFSPVYAVPIKPLITEIKDPKFMGVDVGNGSLTTSAKLPSYKSMGNTISPYLVYKSSWANPTAYVSNLFDIPKSTTQFQYDSSGDGPSKIVSQKVCMTLFGWEQSFTCDVQDYLIKTQYNAHVEGSVSYVPESIRAQLFVSNFASNQVIFQDVNSNDSLPGTQFTNQASSPVVEMTGIPSKSYVSFGVNLKNPNTNEFLATGVYPTIARYEIRLKNMIIRTVSITGSYTAHRLDKDVKDESGDLEPSQTTYKENSIIEYLAPSDVLSNVAVINKVNSEFGRGWNFSAVQKIINPENNSVVIQEENGSLTSYVLNNSIQTVLDGTTNSLDFKSSVSFQSLPSLKAVQRNASGQATIKEYSLTNGQGSDVAPVYQVNFDEFFQTSDDSDKCVKRQISSSPIYKTHLTIPSKVGGITTLSDSSILYSINSTQDSELMLYKNGSTQGLAGQITALTSAGAAVDYSNSQLSNLPSACSQMNIFCTAATTQVASYPCTGFYVGTATGSYINHGDIPGLFKDAADSNSQYASFSNPTTFFQMADGTILVSDTGNNMIREVDFNNKLIKKRYGTGENIYYGDGGQAIDAGIYHPRGLAYDNDGNLYVASEDGYIRKIDPTGIISTIAGLPLGSGGILANDGYAKGMAFNRPSGLAYDKDQNYLYVSDSGNNRVVRIDLSTLFASTVAGSRECKTVNDEENIPAVSSSLCEPTDIAVDGAGNLLVVDSGHKKIRKVVFNNSSGANQLVFLPSARDGSLLQKNLNGGWTRTYRNGTKAQFDSQGLQTSFSDKLDNVTSFTYDSSSRLTEITNPLGQKSILSYSGAKLRSFVDFANRVTQFSYTGDLLTSILFPDGSGKHYEYDTNGQLTKETDQVGSALRYSYNEYNRLATVTDNSNKVVQVADMETQSMTTNYTGGQVGQLMPSGTGPQEVYDRVVDARNIETAVAKDFNGYVVKIVDGKGQVTTIDRDVNGYPLKITFPDQTLTFGYDPNTNDMVSVTDADTGITERKTYDKFGNVTSETDGGGNSIVRVFNQATGLLEKESMAGGAEVSYSYNAKGFVLSKSVKLSSSETKVTSYEYDQFGNLSKVVNPDNTISTLTYDAAGNITDSSRQVSVSIIETMNLEYDNFNRITKVIENNDSVNQVTQYQYDSAGHVSKITDPKGRESKYIFNSKGQMSQSTDFDGVSRDYAYDDSGNVSMITESTGKTFQYTFDELNQLTSAKLPDDDISFKYNSRGDVVEANNRISKVLINRDSRSRIVGTGVVGYGALSSYPQIGLSVVYDNADNRKSISSGNWYNSYDYDSANRLKQISGSNGDVHSYSYDSLNRLVSLSRPGSKTNFDFDSNGEVKTISNVKASTSFSFSQYAYDKRHFPTQITSQNGTKSYQFDRIGRLIASTNGGSPDESFTYDQIGNRLTDLNGSYQYDNSSNLKEDWKYYYTYDLNGNLVQKIAKDGLSKSFLYEYSSSNQLLKASILDKPLGQVIKQITFSYDAIGRRIQKIVWDKNSQLDPAKSYTRNYVYDGESLLFEYDGNNNLLIAYTYGNRGLDDVLSGEITVAGVTAGISQVPGKIYYLKDRQGSVTDITDSSGNVIQGFEYNSFGKISKIRDAAGADITSSPKIVTAFSYTSREWDFDLEVIYLRARYYDPEIGRFLQKDPDAGNMSHPATLYNKYAYAGNSPLVYSDSTGAIFGIDDLLFIGLCALAGAVLESHFDGDRYTLSNILFGGLKGAALGSAIIGVASLIGGVQGAATGTYTTSTGAIWANPIGGGLKGILAPSLGAEAMACTLGVPAADGMFDPNANSSLKNYANTYLVAGAFGGLARAAAFTIGFPTGDPNIIPKGVTYMTKKGVALNQEFIMGWNSMVLRAKVMLYGEAYLSLTGTGKGF